MNKNEFIGKNSLENIKFFANDRRYKKVLIFAGRNSFIQSGAEEQLNKFILNFNHEIFFKENKLPEISELKKFVDKIENFKPEVIVAIGGGAVLDLAKVANCFCKIKDIEANIINSGKNLKKKFCPLIAVPTTAGSGAEATSNAVMYIGKSKYSVEGDIIKPDLIIIDPNLGLSTPKFIAASSGFDAISQAIESMLSVKSTEESVIFGELALKLSLKNFENHINKRNFETSYNMSLAALNSGKAISITKTTAPHALSYSFTAFHGIDHGHAVSLTLNEFLMFNYKNSDRSVANFNLTDRFVKIFEIFKVNNINDLTKNISKILINVGLETNFKKLNIHEKDFELILDNINLQRLANNPIKVQLDDIKKILVEKNNKIS